MSGVHHVVPPSGTLKFRELITEYLDQNDEVVITARTVAVLTEGPK